MTDSVHCKPHELGKNVSSLTLMPMCDRGFDEQMIRAPIFLKFESKKSIYSKLQTPEFALNKSHCRFWDSQFCIATWDLC